MRVNFMNLIGFYNYTVILTYLGAVAAVCGIFFSASGHPFWGVICLLFAGLTGLLLCSCLLGMGFCFLIRHDGPPLNRQV